MLEVRESAPHKPKLDFATNRNACLIVINAIARVPQDGQGRYLMADIMMRFFKDKPYNGKTVSIAQMASIDPDGEFCADRINRIHRRFNIPNVVSPAQARAYVCNFGLIAIETVRDETIAWANGSLPLHIRYSKLRNYILEPDTTTPDSFNWAAAMGLQEHFEENPELRRRVAITLKAKADVFRAQTAELQHSAQLMVLRG